ncbi:indolepyruvate oxidoreductase subunit beta [bacterium]|nr:indolepyruvate oxidoreductase subunit beta [bacterium]
MSKESDRGEKTSMKNIYKIQLIGVGGQGTIKASTIVGEAAMKKGLNVVMSEVHGMARRGGTVVTELKIGEAHSPLIEEGAADLLIAFEPTEALRSLNKINCNSFVIVNSAPIVPFTVSLGISEYPELSSVFDELKAKIKNLSIIDAQKIAKEAGSIISENMVLLGAAVATLGFPVDKDLVIQSMKENLPPKSIETNLRAFELGFKEVKKEGIKRIKKGIKNISSR